MEETTGIVQGSIAELGLSVQSLALDISFPVDMIPEDLLRTIRFLKVLLERLSLVLAFQGERPGKDKSWFCENELLFT
jgi:hypothetical protein